MRNFTIHHGHVIDALRGMESESVHCVVTSPPYWGLRDYGTDGQIGLEKTPEDYVAVMVEIFREVKRILRSDGTLWLNLGDSYFGANWRGSEAIGSKQATNQGANGTQHSLLASDWRNMQHSTLKSKDIVGIPWRVAFALQSDGWWLRSDIIWSKPNPMPESVMDRPTKSHEYIFLLTKSERYFFDADAIREPYNQASLSRYNYQFGKGPAAAIAKSPAVGDGNGHDADPNPLGRNIRSVWSIATSPFPDAHFAVFPSEIPRRAILAGTSEKGVCGECGAPWVRVVEKETEYSEVESITAKGIARRNGEGQYRSNSKETGGVQSATKTRTTWWQPSCKHKGEPIPATVLDPFCGSGTTGLVALRHGRAFIGIELNGEYVAMAERRIINDAPLFNVRVSA